MWTFKRVIFALICLGLIIAFPFIKTETALAGTSPDISITSPSNVVDKLGSFAIEVNINPEAISASKINEIGISVFGVDLYSGTKAADFKLENTANNQPSRLEYDLNSGVVKSAWWPVPSSGKIKINVNTTSWLLQNYRIAIYANPYTNETNQSILNTVSIYVNKIGFLNPKFACDLRSKAYKNSKTVIYCESYDVAQKGSISIQSFYNGQWYEIGTDIYKVGSPNFYSINFTETGKYKIRFKGDNLILKQPLKNYEYSTQILTSNTLDIEVVNKPKVIISKSPIAKKITSKSTSRTVRKGHWVKRCNRTEVPNPNYRPLTGYNSGDQPRSSAEINPTITTTQCNQFYVYD